MAKEFLPGLRLEDYSQKINLLEIFQPPSPVSSPLEALAVVEDLLAELKKFLSLFFDSPKVRRYEEKRHLLQGILSMLEPGTLRPKSARRLDSLLQWEMQSKTIFHAKNAKRLCIAGTQVDLFQGDITTIEADAIVNAANSRLLGCFQPFHYCIDNAIHSAAGVQLRDDCHTIMTEQNAPETTGNCKVTRAYNLPSRFVLHTVGPVVHESVTTEQALLLAQCYKESLNLAAKIPVIRGIVFCCISTGVFGFPQEAAAKIAFSTVEQWLCKNPGRMDYILFNTFSDHDQEIYEVLIKDYERRNH